MSKKQDNSDHSDGSDHSTKGSPRKDEFTQTPENIENYISSYLDSIDKLKLYFVGDKYNNSKLSLAIEEGKINQVREMYPIEKSLSDAELLRKIAIDITSNNVQETYNIDEGVALRIYSEARDQLNLMGEDTSTIVDAYNFD